MNESIFLDLKKLFHDIITFFQGNPVIAVVSAVVFLYLLYSKPKIVLTVIIVAACVVGVMHIVARIFAERIF